MFKRLHSICAAVCIGVLLTSLSGCALFGSELDKAAEGAGKLVTFYCDNIPNEAVREQFRAAVNEHAAPNSVNVTCANGSAPLAVPSPSTTGVHVIMPTKNPHEIERVKKRDAAVAATAENAPPSTRDDERLSSVESLLSELQSRVLHIDERDDKRLSSVESRVGSLESTASTHESRLSSLERRNG